MTASDAGISHKNLERDEFLFFSLLRRTLLSVYGAEPSAADDYQKYLAEAPEAARILALHDDPFDAAAHITGITPTKEMLFKYENISSGPRETGYEVLFPFLYETNPQLVSLDIVARAMKEIGYHLNSYGDVLLWTLEGGPDANRRMPSAIITAVPPLLTSHGYPSFAREDVIFLFGNLLQVARQNEADPATLQRIEAQQDYFLKIFE